MYEIIFYLIGIAIIFCLIRMIKGPTIPDRVIAGDTISSLAIVIIILFAIKYNNMMFIDIAIVISILSFISTIIISKYLLGKEIGEE